MQAVVLHPAKQSFGSISGQLATIKENFRSHAMSTHGFIGNVAIDDVTEFLEWCFDHTNLNEAYREEHKCRGMCVGDVLVVFDVGAYACMDEGWKRIE